MNSENNLEKILGNQYFYNLAMVFILHLFDGKTESKRLN